MVVVATTALADVAATDNVVAPPREGNAKDDVVTDAGILTFRVLQALAPTCTAGYVACVNGNVRGTTASCAATCNGNCCVGTNACKQFTGMVCKDGSCNPDYACYYANLSFVVNSCTGNKACKYAGKKGLRQWMEQLGALSTHALDIIVVLSLEATAE